ncbi:MAG TPA: hypothetical protein VGI25_05390, partial [Candidatus Udaeobacter sp.]
MKLFTTRDQSGKNRDPETAANVAEDVENGRAAGGVLCCKRCHRQTRNRHDRERLTKCAHKIGEPELVARIIKAHADVHVTADREDETTHAN